MKKTIFTIANLLFCVLVFGQSVPQGINYQAVARDANGNEITNQSLTVRLSVISGTASGTLSWQETHSLTTNDFGLFTAVIGQGISTSAGSSSTFDLVDWSSSSHYIKVEIDFGSGYLDLGTNELLSVPYALAAGSATNQHWNKLQNVGWNNDTVLHYDGKIAIGVNRSNVNGYVDFQVGDWNDQANVEIHSVNFDLDAVNFDLDAYDFDLRSDRIRINDYDGFRIDNYNGITTFQAEDGILRLNDYNGNGLLYLNSYGFELYDASGSSWNSTPIFKVDISNSNVGIGTDNPNSSYALDVVGNAQFSGNVSSANQPTQNEHLTRKDYVDAADSTNSSQISTNTTAITTNSSNISINTSAIAAETNRAQAAEATNNTAIVAETARAQAAEAALLDSIRLSDSTIIANQHWNKLQNINYNNDTVLHYDGKIAIGVNQSNINGYADFQVGYWNDKVDVEIYSRYFNLGSDNFYISARDFDLHSDEIKINSNDGFRLDNYSGTTMFQARDGNLRLNDYNGDAILNVNEYDGFEVFDGTGYSYSSTPIFKVDISNSNVGIGTDNPSSSYALDVVGNAQFSGDVSSTNQPTQNEHLTRKDYVDAADSTNSSQISTNTTAITTNSSNISINTSAIAAETTRARAAESTINAAIVAETARAQVVEAALLDSIRLADSTVMANQHWNKLHNIGWNNDTVLHYDGKIAIGVNQSNVNGYADFQVGDYIDKADVEINADDFYLYSDLIRLNDMDGLRLDNYSGYTTFQARDGDLRLNDYNGDAILNVNDYEGFEVFDGSGYSWNSTPIFKVDISNSNVGIGTDNPNSSYALDVVGDAQFSGNVFSGGVLLSSDRRFKREIKTVDNALHKVLQLRGVNYYWKKKDFPNKNFDDKLELGLIAQEVEKIIPEIVEQTEDGYKAVEYQKLVALLVEAIKEQQAIIDEQKTEMTDMRAELDGRLKALEELLNTTTSNK